MTSIISSSNIIKWMSRAGFFLAVVVAAMAPSLSQAAPLANCEYKGGSMSSPNKFLNGSGQSFTYNQLYAGSKSSKLYPPASWWKNCNGRLPGNGAVNLTDNVIFGAQKDAVLLNFGAVVQPFIFNSLTLKDGARLRGIDHVCQYSNANINCQLISLSAEDAGGLGSADSSDISDTLAKKLLVVGDTKISGNSTLDLSFMDGQGYEFFSVALPPEARPIIDKLSGRYKDNKGDGHWPSPVIFGGNVVVDGSASKLLLPQVPLSNKHTWVKKLGVVFLGDIFFKNQSKPIQLNTPLSIAFEGEKEQQIISSAPLTISTLDGNMALANDPSSLGLYIGKDATVVLEMSTRLNTVKIVNDGTLIVRNSSQLELNTLVNNLGGEVKVQGGGKLKVGRISNSGIVTVDSGATMEVTGVYAQKNVADRALDPNDTAAATTINGTLLFSGNSNNLVIQSGKFNAGVGTVVLSSGSYFNLAGAQELNFNNLDIKSDSARVDYHTDVTTEFNPTNIIKVNRLLTVTGKSSQLFLGNDTIIFAKNFVNQGTVTVRDSAAIQVEDVLQNFGVMKLPDIGKATISTVPRIIIDSVKPQANGKSVDQVYPNNMVYVVIKSFDHNYDSALTEKISAILLVRGRGANVASHPADPLVDEETLVLTETEPGSGVFESAPLSISYKKNGPVGKSNNGVIEANADYPTINYIDYLNVSFIDNNGYVSSFVMDGTAKTGWQINPRTATEEVIINSELPVKAFVSDKFGAAQGCNSKFAGLGGNDKPDLVVTRDDFMFQRQESTNKDAGYVKVRFSNLGGQSTGQFSNPVTLQVNRQDGSQVTYQPYTIFLNGKQVDNPSLTQKFQIAACDVMEAEFTTFGASDGSVPYISYDEIKNVQVVVDPDNNVVESNEQNNTQATLMIVKVVKKGDDSSSTPALTEEAPEPPKPTADLSIVPDSLVVANAKGGGTYLSYVVKNVGKAISPAFGLKASAEVHGDDANGNKNVTAVKKLKNKLAVNKKVTVTQVLKASLATVTNIFVTVDTNNDVKEMAETRDNNTVKFTPSRHIRFVTPKGGEAITVSGNKSQATVSFKVMNEGNAPTIGFVPQAVITYSDGSTEKVFKVIKNGLGAKKTSTVNLTVKASKEDVAQVEVWADAYNHVNPEFGDDNHTVLALGSFEKEVNSEETDSNNNNAGILVQPAQTPAFLNQNTSYYCQANPFDPTCANGTSTGPAVNSSTPTNTTASNTTDASAEPAQTTASTNQNVSYYCQANPFDPTCAGGTSTGPAVNNNTTNNNANSTPAATGASTEPAQTPASTNQTTSYYCQSNPFDPTCTNGGTSTGPATDNSGSINTSVPSTYCASNPADPSCLATGGQATTGAYGSFGSTGGTWNTSPTNY